LVTIFVKLAILELVSSQIVYKIAILLEKFVPVPMFPLSVEWSSPPMEIGFGLLYLALALLVTVDVLLKKSDVRSALGWIGAVWLAPLFGSLFYFMFGINRVTRRALKIRRLPNAQANPPVDTEPDASPNIALLTDVSERVTHGPLTAGNAVEILQGGDAAYPPMLAAIRGAKHSIAMASYIFRNDEAGNEFADALIEAHKRGVAVRVLLDGIGAGYFHSGVYLRMRREGVRAENFLHTWLPWRMPFLNMRNHRKLLVVDGATAFLGGINVGSENSSRFSGKRRIHDVHFRVEGPVVRMVMDAFARDWTFTTDEALDDDIWWPKLEAKGTVFARGVRSGPDADLYKTELILGAAINLARQRIRIVTPYFLPEARLQFAIQEACLRGVEVEIVLPSQSDQRVMDWAMRGQLRFFRHIKACFIVTPPPFDHSKICTVDGEWSLVGSSNWDTRSFRLNFEFDLEITDRELTARLDAMIDDKIARGKRIWPDMFAREPIWLRLRNAAARLFMPYL
jgi:cardiolipin synthase